MSELAAFYDMSFAAVQKHVAMLEGAGLVVKHPRGRERIVRGNPDMIRRAQVQFSYHAALATICCHRVVHEQFRAIGGTHPGHAMTLHRKTASSVRSSVYRLSVL